jgi:predicted phosphodiesterase
VKKRNSQPKPKSPEKESPSKATRKSAAKTKAPSKAKPRAASRLFAFISDIHGNLDALEAVLTDIDQVGVDAIFCLGDIIGYGPEPAACVQLIMDRCTATVFGNHESFVYLAESWPLSDFPACIGQPIQLAINQMSPAQAEWLDQLPMCVEMGPLTLSHGSLHEPTEFTYLTAEHEVRPHFQAQTTFASFNGHSHIPCVWEESGEEILCFPPSDMPVRLDPSRRYSINVGSVGQPRDCDYRASYALYNIDTQVLLHRRVAYDLAKARARFAKAGIPKENAERIVLGH